DLENKSELPLMAAGGAILLATCARYPFSVDAVDELLLRSRAKVRESLASTLRRSVDRSGRACPVPSGIPARLKTQLRRHDRPAIPQGRPQRRQFRQWPKDRR